MQRKRRTIEYFQQLQNKVLEEEATLLEGAKGFQSAESNAKKLPPEIRRGNSPPRRLGESN